MLLPVVYAYVRCQPEAQYIAPCAYGCSSKIRAEPAAALADGVAVEAPLRLLCPVNSDRIRYFGLEKIGWFFQCGCCSHSSSWAESTQSSVTCRSIVRPSATAVAPSRSRTPRARCLPSSLRAPVSPNRPFSFSSPADSPRASSPATVPPAAPPRGRASDPAATEQHHWPGLLLSADAAAARGPVRERRRPKFSRARRA